MPIFNKRHIYVFHHLLILVTDSKKHFRETITTLIPPMANTQIRHGYYKWLFA